MTTTPNTPVSELIVPLDGRDASVRAVPVAGRIASRLGLGVRLFAASTDEGSNKESWMQSVAEAHLAGTEVTFEVVGDGDPVAAIVTAAGESGMVCMATAASLLPHQGHIGSVAEGVTRDIGRPVILVGPEMETSPGEHTTRLVVPVDGSSLSEAILPVAADLAVALNVPAWVVTVVSPSLESSSHMGVDAISIGVGYLRRLAGQIRDSHGIDAEYEVLHRDNPAEAIVDFTGDDGTVVMTTHGRSGLSRLFGGSVATGVVAHSKRAVIVWHPANSD
jgi:nucleotide-binding universal stress UspA family protein